MSEKIEYIHLAPREGSSYRQFFVKARNLRAETLFRATVGSEPMTPEDVRGITTCRLRRFVKPFIIACATRLY